jgi:heptaprenyl diphosphate synthase
MLTASPGSKNCFNNDFSRSLCIFASFCFFLSAIEYMIPKPLPFMRIGISNIPLMLALGIFPLSKYLVLVCMKIAGQALITGTLFSYVFLFSMAGTFFSALFMYFLFKVPGRKHITFVGIGTAGAFISNLSQLALAFFFVFGENVFFIIPLFMAAGLVTGIVLGIFCECFAERSQWYRSLNEQTRNIF